jgi:ribosomal protein S13
MLKFLKVEVDSVDHIIPINSILGIEVGSPSQVQILTNIKGHGATGASEVLGYQLVATTANDAAKTKEQLNSIVDEIETALSTAWTKPMYLLKPKYPITAVGQIEEEWSN